MDERAGRPPGGSLAQGSTKLAMESLLQIEYADKIGNISSVNGKTASVNKDGLSCRKTTGGAVLTFSFPKEGFVIPSSLLSPRTPWMSPFWPEIQETNDAYRLTTLSLLPYFGRRQREDGYLFVPDGSGASSSGTKPAVSWTITASMSMDGNPPPPKCSSINWRKPPISRYSG